SAPMASAEDRGAAARSSRRGAELAGVRRGNLPRMGVRRLVAPLPERAAGTVDGAGHDPCSGQLYGAASRREKARLRGGHPPHGTEAPAHTDGSLRLSIGALSTAPGPRTSEQAEDVVAQIVPEAPGAQLHALEGRPEE